MSARVTAPTCRHRLFRRYRHAGKKISQRGQNISLRLLIRVSDGRTVVFPACAGARAVVAHHDGAGFGRDGGKLQGGFGHGTLRWVFWEKPAVP